MEKENKRNYGNYVFPKDKINWDLVLFWILVIFYSAMILFSFVGVLYLLFK